MNRIIGRNIILKNAVDQPNLYIAANKFAYNKRILTFMISFYTMHKNLTFLSGFDFMPTQKEMNQVFDAVVSTLKTMPKLKWQCYTDESLSENFLEAIKSKIDASLYAGHEGFFANIYAESFSQTYEKYDTRISFFMYQRNSPNYFKFCINLDLIALKIIKNYAFSDTAFKVPLVYISSEVVSEDLKLTTMINNGARPYFKTSFLWWSGAILGGFECLAGAAFFLFGLLGLLSSVMCFVSPDPVGIGLRLGASLFLAAGALSAFCIGAELCRYGAEQLANAYADVFDNTTETSKHLSAYSTSHPEAVSIDQIKQNWQGNSV